MMSAAHPRGIVPMRRLELARVASVAAVKTWGGTT